MKKYTFASGFPDYTPAKFKLKKNIITPFYAYKKGEIHTKFEWIQLFDLVTTSDEEKIQDGDWFEII